MTETWALKALKWIIAAVASTWLSIPGAVQLLIILCSFDLLACLFTPIRSFRETLRRITVTLLLCGAVHVVFVMAKDLSGFNVGFDIGTAVVVFYIVGEILEITIMCSSVAPIPPKLVEWLEAAQGMTGQQRKEFEELKRENENASD